MPVDFTDFLRSLRADGKLIVSSVIKAAAGKRIVTDVSETANDVTIEREDETGSVSQVVISKVPGAAGTDSTARAAAAMAQLEIDVHEVSTHNTDTVARAAAVTAQGEIDTHEANHPSGVTISTDAPGNTPGVPAAGDSGEVSDSGHDHGITPGQGGGADQTARDSAAAAQTAADAAQGEIDTHEASTHNTDTAARATAATNTGSLDSHIANHPGGTVPGPPAAASVGRAATNAYSFGGC